MEELIDRYVALTGHSTQVSLVAHREPLLAFEVSGSTRH